MPPHNSHLMGHSEFLHGSRMISLPLNISEKLQARRDRARLVALIFVNMIQHAHTLKNSIHHLTKRRPPSFFDSETSLVLGKVLVHSVEKTHVIVVTVELIWLLFCTILSLNFVRTPNKSLRFRKFRKSCVHRSIVVQTNHFKLTLLFLLDVRYSKWSHSCFVFVFQLLLPNDGAFA